MAANDAALHVRWLGRVPYREALALQQAMFERGTGDHLLVLEHPHVFTHGPRADLAANIKVAPSAVDAELVGVRRGGDVTYHGPGQLVGYPIVNVPNALGASDHVSALQRLIVGTLEELVEVMTWAQLDRHAKPIVLCNIDSYWNPLLTLVEHMRAEKFIREGLEFKLDVVTSALDVIPAFEARAKVNAGKPVINPVRTKL